MWIIIVAAVVSFLTGIAFAAWIIVRLRKLPGLPVQEIGTRVAPATGAVEDRTRPVERLELEILAEEARKPRGLAAFEEKTRQVAEFEFSDLLQIDHEEMIAEPVATDSEEQMEIARQDIRRLELVIENSGPLPSTKPGGFTLAAVPPSHYVFTTRSDSTGLMN